MVDRTFVEGIQIEFLMCGWAVMVIDTPMPRMYLLDGSNEVH